MTPCILSSNFLIFKFYVYRSREKRTSECYEFGGSDNENKKNWKGKITLLWKKRTKYNKKWWETDLKFAVLYF